MDAACCFENPWAGEGSDLDWRGVSAEIQMGQDPWCRMPKIQAHHPASRPARGGDSGSGREGAPMWEGRGVSRSSGDLEPPVQGRGGPALP